MRKRLLSIFLCLCMVVGMLPAITPTAQAWEYAPSHYGVNIGGPSYTTSTNPFYASGWYGQCTWYCWGRALEKCGVSLPCRGAANTWYDTARNNGFSVGSQPRANSIAVFAGTGENTRASGHVLFVEEVSGTTVKCSESNYWNKNDNKTYAYWERNYNTWDTTLDSGVWGLSLIGYIYLGSSTPTQPPASSYTSMNFGTGFYAIIRSQVGDFALSNAGDGNYSNYGNVQIERENFLDPRQVWYFVWDSSCGAYKIVNEYDGRCLDVLNGKNERWTNIGMWESNDGTPQRWKLVRDPDDQNTTFNMIALSGTLFADVDGGYAIPGTNLQLYERNHALAQQFALAKLEGSWQYSKPAKPSMPTFRSFSVTPERSIISWNAVPAVNSYDNREYILEVYDVTNSRYVLRNQRVTGTSYTAVLPVGSYRAEVQAVNTKYSNYKSGWNMNGYFTVYPTRTVAITAVPAEGGAVYGDGIYNQGDYTTLTARPSEGWHLKGWTRNGQPITDGVTVGSIYSEYGLTITGDETFEVLFERDSQPAPMYTINVASTPADAGSVTGGGTYEKGTEVTVTAEAHEGYDFKGWQENGQLISGAGASYTFIAGADRSLTAIFEAKPDPTYTITVTASPNEGGSVTGGNTYTKGDPVTVTATPNEGYTFKYWAEGSTAVSSETSYTFTASADRTLTAIFEAIPDPVDPPAPATKYTITVLADPTAGGTVSGGGQYEENQQVTVTATPASNYRFVEWQENGAKVSENANYSITVSGDRMLTAIFERIEAPAPVNYAVNVTTAGGGTVSGGGSYKAGTSVTVTATPASGYQFVEWQENGVQVSTNASYQFQVAANRILTAVFEKLLAPTVSYTVSLSATPGGTVSGSGSYEENTSVTVTAVPATNYHFVEWQENGETVSESPSYQFTITGNRNLRAIFAEDAPVQKFRYDVDVTALPAEGGSVSGGGSFEDGTEVTVTATPAAGYHFLRWAADSSELSRDAGYTFTVRENVSLTAVFERDTVTLTVVNGTGSGDYEAGTVVSIVANAAPEGKVFDKWTTNNGGTFVDMSSASTTFTMPTGDVTVTATYRDISTPPVPATYLINFDPSGGTVDIICMTTGADGKLSILPVPIYNNYRFKGWYTALNGGEQITTDTIFNSNTTVYAQWSYIGDSGIIIPGSGYTSTGDTVISAATYNITISPVSDGIVKTSHTSAKSGTTVTISVTPNEGYKLDKLTATDSNGNELKLTEKGDAKYTFIMPNSMVAVDAVFKLDEEPIMPSITPGWVNHFTDVIESAWYYDAVKFVSENSLMNGLSSTIFAPAANLSRAQLAQILYNKEGKPAVNSASSFTDVAAGDWYASAVVWAAANNIVGGYGNGQFGPNDNITREQLAVMLWRYAGEPIANGNLAFSDADQISDFAHDAIRWAVENKILSGKGSNILDPKGVATRAEVAQMLKNYLNS